MFNFKMKKSLNNHLTTIIPNINIIEANNFIENIKNHILSTW